MPYKDPYMEYLRQLKKRIEQAERIRELHKIWREQNHDKVREQNKESKKKQYNKNPDLFKKRRRAYNTANKIPMKDYCELCPEEDNKGRKLNRHHFDYDYREIFLTVCDECHTWITLQNNSDNKLKRKKGDVVKT